MDFFWIAILALSAYAVFVLLAEGLIWKIQPSMGGGITLFVPGADGAIVERNLYGHRQDGRLYVSSNHWFRSWYRLAVEHPDVEVDAEGTRAGYTAVPITGEERMRVMRGYHFGLPLRFLCGFAPRKLLRLDPRN